jgi:glycosidase
MSRVVTKNKFLVVFVLILSLVTIVGCSSTDSEKDRADNSELKLNFSKEDASNPFELEPEQVTVSLINQTDESDKKERTKDYNNGDVAFDFADLKQNTTYNIDVTVVDAHGYNVYQGSSSPEISHSSQTKTVKLNQTKVKGLVVNFKNVPENAAAGTLKLVPAQESLETEIDLSEKKAQFNDIIASNYVLEVKLSDSEGKTILTEQTNSNLKVLPGRVTTVEVDLSTETNLVVDVDWGSTIAPQAPTGLATTATEAGVELTWDDNADEYLVYRGTSVDKKLPLERSQNNIYTDRTALAGNTYYYWVRAIGKDGLNSDLSTEIQATAVPSQYNGVKVHFKDTGGTPQVYAWYNNSNGEKVEPKGAWPGAEMIYEGNDWYQAEFPEINDLSLIFIPSTGEDDQTPTLTRSQNEWWYKDGEWYSALPAKPQKPEVSFDLKEGTYQGDQNLDISVIGKGLEDLSAEFNGQSVSLNDTDNKIDKTTIQLGDYLEDGETAEITVTAANDLGTTTNAATYTRDDSYEGDFVFHFKHSESSRPNIYAWRDNGDKLFGPWPGAKMTDNGDGYYVYKLKNVEFSSLNIKFNWNNENQASDDLEVSTPGEYWYQDRDGDGSKEFYKKAKPTVSISPGGGTYQGNKMIQVSLQENGSTITEASYEFKGQTVDLLEDTEKTFALSDYLADQESATMTVNVTNELGTVTEEVSYTRDDNSTTELTGFTWDNASVYFVITDRFFNADESNDNSYGRPQEDATGKEIGTFHGGDIPGLKEKIESGYFEELGINALWITAPYEQIHGFVGGGNGDFAHYAYHGYYALDYTAMDKNMGTVKQFRDFVNTAHENGIRIVMDVVMNHPGYNTVKDMNKYNFGAWKDEPLSSDWSPDSDENWHSYHDSIDYENGADKWAKWWSPSWMRAGLPGYDSGGNDQLTKLLSGLPDFKTELETDQGLPPILQTKWEQEDSSYDDWVVPVAQDLRTDLGLAPADYITEWLTAWVEEFGIDGFRVDTAKHVGKEQWGQLKQSAQDSLETWRANNSTAPGADWDEDFWMVGEVNPHGVDKSRYFDDNNGDGVSDFDAVINFNFPKNGDLSTIGSTWQEYANKINSDDEFNVLSYISSHDTSLGALDNKIDAGTALLLAPGAVQIMYGDEVDRKPGPSGSDDTQGTRADYPWSGGNQDVLTHWQKLGQFRRNHPAVGAGDQTSLGSDSYLRTLGSDKVVIKINASGSTTIDLNDIFADGQRLRNAYTGTEAEVINGEVEFEAENGVILIEKVK